MGPRSGPGPAGRRSWVAVIAPSRLKEADTHAVRPQHLERGAVQAGRDRGRDGDRHADRLRIGSELAEVTALQAVASGQHQDRGRRPGCGQLVDEGPGLVGRELARRRFPLRGGSAVHTSERARLRRLPEDQTGHEVEGRRPVRGARPRRLSSPPCRSCASVPGPGPPDRLECPVSAVPGGADRAEGLEPPRPDSRLGPAGALSAGGRGATGQRRRTRKQHCLYLRRLPHGHGSLRPVVRHLARSLCSASSSSPLIS